jgi:hypothetical protein
MKNFWILLILFFILLNDWDVFNRLLKIKLIKVGNFRYLGADVNDDTNSHE